MPQEPTCAPADGQTTPLLPFENLSRSQRRRRLKLARELGVPADQVPDRRGRHGNHARGKANARWNAEGRMLSEHGYVKVRVGRGHPLADPNGYAYEHLLVWITAGHPLPGPDELIHHVDEDKTNNRIDNLELKSRGGHAVHHNTGRPRDDAGRFLPAPDRGGGAR